MAEKKISTTAAGALVLVQRILALWGCNNIKSTNKIWAASAVSVPDDCELLDPTFLLRLMLFI